MNALIDRIDRLSLPVPEAGCWLWLGATVPRGYGKLTIRTGVTAYAHRVSWMAHFGEIPEGHYVCHKCDTPSCVNPAHLFIGSPSDNHMDMTAKGRASIGASSSSAKLSEDQVVEIRSSTDTGRALAARHGVSASTISLIRTGQRWKQLNALR